MKKNNKQVVVYGRNMLAKSKLRAAKLLALLHYNNRRPGRSGDGNAGRDAGGQAGTTGTSSSVIVFFLLSSFLLLTFTISFVANYSNRRSGAEWDGTGREDAGGDSNTGRYGGQAGGRRR